MTVLLPALAVAFAAFCVWLGVRIFNRHERWAKWTLAVTLALPMLYVASFGPACGLASNGYLDPHVLETVYSPFIDFLFDVDSTKASSAGYTALVLWIDIWDGYEAPLKVMDARMDAEDNAMAETDGNDIE